MALFIADSILMVALAAMLYLMVRALPRIAEEPLAERSGLLDRWARSQFPEKADRFLNDFFLKFLRKLKVLVLKFENGISNRLEKVKPEDNDKKPAIDFKEIAGKTEEHKVEARDSAKI